MNNLAINIAGAGIGGLATALALLRAGMRVRVYEANSELGEVGAGLSLSPNATAGLHHLGLAEQLAEAGYTPASFGVRHYSTGELLLDNTYEMTRDNTLGSPYYMIHRADLHSLLLDAVRSHDPDCVLLKQSVREVETIEEDAIMRFENGAAARADLIVGCDGIRSTVREQLFGRESPQFTGFIAWRGLVPIADLDPAVLESESALCIGPGKTLTRYLIRPRGLVNYVAVARRSGWEVENWSVRSDVSEVLEEFSEFHSSMRDILAATPPDRCFKWALFDRDPLQTWSRGRVTIAGDAAHPMLPFMGQGAVMAIEDAVVLARCLQASASVTEALQRYERARVERCALVMLESRANIERLQADPENYNRKTHKNEHRLGLFDYDAAAVAI